MLISIVIPTRHRNDLLARCLQQLAADVQSFPADCYEVIVTDDGATTTAEAMIRARFPWVRWTAGPRQGPAANRNNGAALARGEWIAFTDDDCVPASTWLSAYADAAVHMKGDLFEGRTTCREGLRHFSEDAPINDSGGHLPSCNMMIRFSLFRRLGGFDEKFPSAIMEDVDLRERLRIAGQTANFVSEAIVDHPPRPRVRGKAAGAMWEGRAYYEIKWGHMRQTAGWMPGFVLKVRAAELLKGWSIRSYPAALRSMLAEWKYVRQHVAEWDSRYADCFATVETPDIARGAQSAENSR